NMAAIAKGFGVDGEVVESPGQLREALARARKATVEGKPYLIDAQVARKGVAWADKPWIPPIQVAAVGEKRGLACTARRRRTAPRRARASERRRMAGVSPAAPGEPTRDVRAGR